MNIYEWKKPEEPLDSPMITAKHMTVTKVDDKGNTLYAEGTFTFYDHVEGVAGQDPWVATATFTGDTFGWVVRRKDIAPGDFAFQSEDGEPLFCLCGRTNAAIKKFVASKLTMVVNHMREHVGEEICIIEESPRYSGVKHSYNGPCVCQKILSSNLHAPFDWKTCTNGGQYPKNCFECSCKARWYRGNPEEELWLRVGDPKAWQLLTEFDGVPSFPIALDPDSKEPVLVLQSTLRSRGFIPIA